jgi:hypothetical protein
LQSLLGTVVGRKEASDLSWSRDVGQVRSYLNLVKLNPEGTKGATHTHGVDDIIEAQFGDERVEFEE